MDQNAAVSELAQTMVLGALLASARERWGVFEILDHWQQGAFHHECGGGWLPRGS